MLAALIGLLMLTMFGAFLIVRGVVLAPLIGNLNRERTSVALFISEQIERADDLEARAASLSEETGVVIEIRTRPLPPRPMARARIVQRKGRNIYVFRGQNTPIVVPLERRDQPPVWLVMRFPVDLDAPPRRVGLGMLVLLLAAILTAWGISRWVLRPLEMASQGMRRVASGDLDHRLPESSDVAGQIGETFNQMADQVQSLVEGQRNLMAAVSHELRTPLARMRLQIALIRDITDDAGRLDALEADVAEIDALVEELLESARLERGFIALSLGEVRLFDLFAEALGGVDLGDRDISLQVPDDLAVMADRRRLLRAVSNLLSNIARYTPADTSVELSARRVEEQVVVVVADDGPGVREADLARLFDPFFRAEGSRSKATGGLGLGLMLVRQIVEAHNGGIVAQANGEKGLRVVLTLPTQPTADGSPASA
ncbi:MAG: ATP-binding protein [Myxococcota bacterium]